MTGRTTENSQHAYARFAGFMFLIALAIDVAGVVIVSSISGNGTFLDTAHNIAASETLYRIGTGCVLVGNMSTLLLALGLYVTVRPVDGNLAMTALLFRLAESTIGGMVAVVGFATLQIYLEANHTTINSLVFFGPFDILIGYLILRSTFLPRILGALMVLAGLGWLTFLSLPPANFLVTYIEVLGFLAEALLMLWLLVKGVNDRRWEEQASASRKPDPSGPETAAARAEKIK